MQFYKFQINCVFQLTGKLIWWFIISLLPKEWPDIFFNNNGLSISDKRSFAESTTDRYYDPRRHSFTRNLQEVALRFLEDIDDKIEKVNQGIL